MIKINSLKNTIQKHYIIKLKNMLSHNNHNDSIAHVVGKPLAKFIDISIGEYFRNITQKYPNQIALNSYSQDKTFTYQQLYQKSLSLATGFIKHLQLKPKDRIGIYSFNKWQWYIIQLAATLADLILVNINPSYRAEQLAYTIQKVGLKVLITNENFKKSNYLEIIRKIIPELNNSQTNPWNIKSKKFPNLQSIIKIDGKRQNGLLMLEDLFIPGKQSLMPKHPHYSSQANIQFTSGTTGLPKAATLSHSNILNNAYHIGHRCNYTHADNIAIPVPLYHCFGMIMGNMAALTRGGSVTYICQGFDAKKTLEAISKYKCTSLYGVPTMFIQYLKQYQERPQKYNISNLRTGIIAGALCPQILMNQILNKLGIKQITNCYGMTQTSPVSFQTSPIDDIVKKTTTVGTILDGLEAKIINQKGQPVKRGQPGEFVVKGWGVMIKYWGDQKATKKSILDDGWMKSGDQAVLSHDGYLTIVGRIKDMIIRGGENVYPKQVQDYIHKYPGIIDVQVIGISDQKYGQQIVALVKLSKDIKLTKQQIYNFCKGNIAHYKIPKYIKFVQEFPLTVTGKPQKYIMRQQIEKQRKQFGLKKYQVR